MPNKFNDENKMSGKALLSQLALGNHIVFNQLYYKYWLKAIHQDNLAKWPQLSDLKDWYNEVARLYAVKAIPNIFLLSPEGKIIARNLTGEDLSQKLKVIFDQ